MICAGCKFRKNGRLPRFVVTAFPLIPSYLCRQKNENRMKQKTELPEGLCTDETVCFIAGRHHVTPQRLLRHFLDGDASIPLEANEVEILKGLSELIKEDRITNIKTR